LTITGAEGQNRTADTGIFSQAPDFQNFLIFRLNLWFSLN